MEKDIKITLERAIVIGSPSLRFSTSSNITNRELLKFYSEVFDLVKRTDPNLNYFGVLDKHRNFLGSYTRIYQAAQQRTNTTPKIDYSKDVPRHYSLEYRRTPPTWKKVDPERMKQNMFSYIKPFSNLEFTFPEQSFSPREFMDILLSFKNVGVIGGFDFEVFNPREIMRENRGLLKKMES